MACSGPGQPNCTTIIYYPNDVPWVTRLMTSLGHSQELAVDQVVGRGRRGFLCGAGCLAKDFEELYNYTANQPNMTHLAVQFTSACERP